MSRRVISGFRRGAWVVLFAAAVAAAQSSPVTLSESGSTLIYPVFQTWARAYAKSNPGLHITVAPTGSGAGISQAIAGRVRIGTSDAYMSDNDAMRNPSILNIPLAISAQTIDVNIPSLRGGTLKLSGPVLAGIYSGRIRSWDAAPIAALNRGVSLPHHAIIPVRRSDSSGDTFIFTQFLSFSTPQSEEDTGQGWDNTIGYGTDVRWPQVGGVLTASGNEGMVQTLARTPYSVGYVGASYESDAAKDGLLVTMLRNQAGNFVLPSFDTVTQAADALTPRTPPDERLTLVFAPGANSYPLINYEYAIVSARQPSAATASALSNFLMWCISPQGGNDAAFLGPVHFIPLPTAIRARSEIQISKIQ